MRVVLAALACVAANAGPREGLESYTFQHYTAEFSKQYKTVEEYTTRRETFEENLELILAHNQAGHSWWQDVNQFTDMSEAERKAFTGLNKPLSRERSQLSQPREALHYGAIPTELDWRDKAGIVTAVKDQSHCGSCWAFASAETIESFVALATGRPAPILSPQDLVSCVPNPRHCGGQGGCDGAIAELAFEYVANKSIAAEVDYPYRAMTGTCNQQAKKTAKVTGYVKTIENNYTDVITALATQGPVAISVDASSWFSYGGGVFAGCSARKTLDIDHAVQAVGYGVDSAGKEYWLVRNSWGPTWGEKGYIRLARHSDGDLTKWCYKDSTPMDGSGCDGGPSVVTVCGECGIWYDVAYPTGARLL
jgi:cathepsin L